MLSQKGMAGADTYVSIVHRYVRVPYVIRSKIKTSSPTADMHDVLKWAEILWLVRCMLLR